MGYVAAPVVKTESSGWLYTWAWGIQKASKKKDNAWKFISWASSKQYEELVGSQLGWSKVPAGKRASTYENPEYLKEAAARSPSRPATAIESADPRNPGVQPRPAIGIQFVDIPEFTDLAPRCRRTSARPSPAGRASNAALDKGQGLASDVAERYKAREKKK